MDENKNNYVFGLDIGTRSLVGTVGYLTDKTFNVIAMAVKEHETRAMLDGQIHDIETVGNSIRSLKEELEKKAGIELTDVCIAAAGRVLRTVTVHVESSLQREARVSGEDVYTLDMLAVEKAHNMVNSSKTREHFFCVGYSPVKYYLDDNELINITEHKGKKMGVDMLATFLPEDVVDGLYSAVEIAGLKVLNLTLEPIAAINVAIPENFRMLNIAMVDVGVGTSDISITRDGSIVAYGMIPQAGDELTEIISKEYLVDFATADRIKIEASKKKVIQFKDIMGIKQKVTKADIEKLTEPIVKKITKEIADKIIELNGGNSVSAVFVVGGGGRIHGFTDSLAEYLSISKERVAVRGEEVLHDVRFRDDITITKDSLIVTPIGICISYYLQTNNFIFVNFNGKRIKMYNNNRLNVVSVALMAGFPNSSLFPKRGKELVYYVDGQKRMLRGEIGDSCIITLNGKPADINSEVSANDKIVIKESTSGKDAELTLAKLPEIKGTINIIINGKEVPCPKLVAVNGELKSEYYSIQNNDKIEFLKSYSLKQLIEYADLNPKMNTVRVNNEEASEYTTVYENFTVTYESMTEENGDEY